MDIGSTYRDTRERVTALLRDAGDGVGDSPVPACPDWTVHDVAAHLAGTCTDILDGNLDGVATDEWTAAQVEARRDRTLTELLGEWNEAAPQVEAFADAFPGRAAHQWIADQTTHEHDVRGALGAPGGREGNGIAVGLEFFVSGGLAASFSGRGLGPVRVEADVDAWLVGAAEPTGEVDELLAAAIMGGDLPDASGDPVATVRTSRFELFRALSGRRSRAQIAAFEWSCDPEPYLGAFQYGPFTLRSEDLVE